MLSKNAVVPVCAAKFFLQAKSKITLVTYPCHVQFSTQMRDVPLDFLKNEPCLVDVCSFSLQKRKKDPA